MTLSGNGTQALTATVHPVGFTPQGLTSQSQVALTPLTRGEFDFAGQRYLQATFTVENRSTTDLTHLTFLAVSTPQTLSGTPIASFRRFDGSPADPAIASQLRPTQPLNLVSAQPQVIQEDADFQAYAETDVSPAAFARPAGVLDVFPYGFVAHVPGSGSRTIPAGGSGQVTVALKIPLQASTAANPFTLSLMVEAVTDSTPAITRSPEEFGTGGLARVQARVAALQALFPTTPVVLRTLGCPVPGVSLSPLRTAGPAGAPTVTIGPPFSLVALRPQPFLSAAEQLSTAPSFTASFDTRVQGLSQDFTVQGSQSGRFTLEGGAGTATLTRRAAHPLHAGEEVQVALNRTLQSTDGAAFCAPFSARYRVATQPEGAPGAVLSGQPAVGSTPESVVVGDLNGDGRLDSVAGNIRDNTVSVLLGNGDGTFQPKRDVAVGLRPQGVTLEDVNADGHLDLLTANMDDSTVSVLLGNGDGTFQARQDLPTGSAPVGVVTADINGDGHQDVLTADSNTYGESTDSTVSLLLGNGDGTFQPRQGLGFREPPNALAVADVNNDGVPDLLSALDTSVAVRLGNGDSSFRTAPDVPVGNIPNSIATGDLNGDTHLDLVVVNFSDKTLSVLLGNGDGTFQPQTVITPSSSYLKAVAMGDVNGDGHLDLVTANLVSSDVSVLLGNGDGTLQSPQVMDAGERTYPAAVALGDLNGDGRLDVLTADSIARSLSVFLKN
ncbi:FG-GAP-like repeat-containing protein [Deinococcus ruber]|nr:FG-GAP-like repeat-containing protein [Deinococcus ruber]